MKSVFILWHIHHISADKDDTKLSGVYSNRKAAEQKIELKYKPLPGGCEHRGKFIIDEYVIDKDHWEEGFISEKFTDSENKRLHKGPLVPRGL